MSSALLPDDHLDEGPQRVEGSEPPKGVGPEIAETVDSASTTSSRPRFLHRHKGLPANSLKVTVRKGHEHVVTYEVAEQMRLLMVRANLGRDAHCLAITSTVSGEGSSYIARSLAAVLAHDSDLRVCLLEFNWDDHGAEETTNDVAVLGIAQDGVEDTGKEFTVVTSGSVAPLQRSLFVGADSLAEDIESFREYFDVVILDLPSIASHSGVLALSEYADRYVLVARQGVAPTAQVRAAIDDLGKEYLAGVVLNQAEFDAPKWLTGLTGV